MMRVTELVDGHLSSSIHTWNVSNLADHHIYFNDGGEVDWLPMARRPYWILFKLTSC
jgi:hypothetical protein